MAAAQGWFRCAAGSDTGTLSNARAAYRAEGRGLALNRIMGDGIIALSPDRFTFEIAKIVCPGGHIAAGAYNQDLVFK